MRALILLVIKSNRKLSTMQKENIYKQNDKNVKRKYTIDLIEEVRAMFMMGKLVKSFFE